MGAKRYFWLKLMGDFFDKTEIRLIEKAPNGKELVLLYLKLLCRSIESEGYLLFNGRPYSEEIIAMITDTSPEIVKMGISLFEQYGLIERKENTFFMPQIVRNPLGGVEKKAERKTNSARNGQCPRVSKCVQRM